MCRGKILWCARQTSSKHAGLVGGGNKIHPPSWKLFKSLEFVSKTSTASLCKPSRSRPPPAANVQLVQQQRKQGQDDKIIEGSLEVKLPTIWTDEKQSRAEAERRERLEERRVEEKESEERRCKMREKVGKSRNTVFFQ